jgi:lipopolysaccharide transport system ATP-binding protein
MSDLAINIDNIGKRYRISHQSGHNRYHTLQETLLDIPSRFFKRHSQIEDFWALKDISFNVSQGERVGIIGSNGAGKSTLLKILSNITEPTVGKASIYGRVGSLLEVGTGFHPELTGRENIFLSGAILGMTRSEIMSRFDEIVDFAEISKFLDTPAKRYSSGMYIRLAFAVAAHLTSEILFVDEVLAVGDSAFQKKCLLKMGDISRGGRTILFVSHNMAAVQNLCQRGIVLKHGMITLDDEIGKAISHYTQQIDSDLQSAVEYRKDRTGTNWLTFTKVELSDEHNSVIQRIVCGQHIKINLFYKSTRILREATVVVGFTVTTSANSILLNLNTYESGDTVIISSEGRFECYWPNFPLRSGVYYLTIYCQVNGEMVDLVQRAFSLSVEDGDFFKSGKLIPLSSGVLYLTQHKWTGYAV